MRYAEPPALSHLDAVSPDCCKVESGSIFQASHFACELYPTPDLAGLCSGRSIAISFLCFRCCAGYLPHFSPAARNNQSCYLTNMKRTASASALSSARAMHPEPLALQKSTACHGCRIQGRYTTQHLLAHIEFDRTRENVTMNSAREEWRMQH